MKKINDNIINIGVADFKTDLFEGQYRIPNGICYNSYLVLDDYVTVFDTVDKKFTTEWMETLEKSLNGRQPDYLVLQHMEPDHAGSISGFLTKYPNVQIVANTKSFALIARFNKNLPEFNKKVVADGETLCTGTHTFKFIFAPMVHWPEVMVSYEIYSKTLFSADAFGTFGVCEDNEKITPANWADEACRYYIGIVGKYGSQVQTLIKKLAPLEIDTICSLHGPHLSGDLSGYIELYDSWSSNRAEKEGVVIAYASAYGNTETAVEMLAENLSANGCGDVKVFDLARCDMSKAIAEAFRYPNVVLASITYNSGIFPVMTEFINGLTERNFQNKTVGIIENGSWGPIAGKVMTSMLERCKNITYAQNKVTVNSAVDDTAVTAISALADELCG